MKKIGILGSGAVAQTLGYGFIRHGFDVMLGTREPGKLFDWKQQSGGRTGSMKEAAAYGEMVVLSVKGEVAEELAKDLSQELAGKVIIDTTNPIAAAPPENGVLSFFTSLDRSLMEILQGAVPAGHFVKAFSCVGNLNMVNPSFPDGKPTMFICGNNVDAKSEVSKLLEVFGWDVADMGGVEAARAIEPLCILWCIPGFLHNKWTHAFKLLT